MIRMFEQDNPSKQTLVFPTVIKRYDAWTGRVSIDLVSVGQKVAHFCPDCADWWGCQATPCETPQIASCGACVLVFDGVLDDLGPV